MFSLNFWLCTLLIISKGLKYSTSTASSKSLPFFVFIISMGGLTSPETSLSSLGLLCAFGRKFFFFFWSLPGYCYSLKVWSFSTQKLAFNGRIRSLGMGVGWGDVWDMGSVSSTPFLSNGHWWLPSSFSFFLSFLCAANIFLPELIWLNHTC